MTDFNQQNSDQGSSAATAHARALAKLQWAVSRALRTGRIDDATWEDLQSALVESNREVDPRG